MMVPLKDPTEEPSTRKKISSIGLDIAKNGFDESGVTVLTNELKRATSTTSP